MSRRALDLTRFGSAGSITAFWCIVVCVAALSSAAPAQQIALSKFHHVRIGGSLAYPPYIFTHQVWFRDIVYDSLARDTQDTSLDVYVADPLEPRSPVMIWVHGGGLVMGDKASSKDLASKPEYFTSKLGFILVSINYRLLPEGKYPRNVQDVADALAWVHAHIAEFGGDPDQMFLIGHSSGAELVTQVATDEEFLKKAGLDLRILKGVIAIEGDYGVIGADADAPRLEASYGPKWRRALAAGNVKSGKNIRRSCCSMWQAVRAPFPIASSRPWGSRRRSEPRACRSTWCRSITWSISARMNASGNPVTSPPHQSNVFWPPFLEKSAPPNGRQAPCLSSDDCFCSEQ